MGGDLRSENGQSFCTASSSVYAGVSYQLISFFEMYRLFEVFKLLLQLLTSTDRKSHQLAVECWRTACMILLHLTSSHQDHQLETFKTQREGQRGDRDAAERSVTSAGQWGLFFWFSTRTDVFSDLPSGAGILPIDARNLARMDHGEKHMITQVIWSLHPLPKAHGSAHTFCWGELEKNQVHYMESLRTNCKIIILQESVVVWHE